MPSRGFITLEDFDFESTTTSFHVRDVTELTYDATLIDINALKSAIAAVTLGEIRASGFSRTFPESSAVVANSAAQRENKWLVLYKDTSQFLNALNTVANPGWGKLFTTEIGTADITNTALFKPNSKEMDISVGLGAALKEAFEDVVRSPYNYAFDDGTVEVQSIIHVGRNT